MESCWACSSWRLSCVCLRIRPLGASVEPGSTAEAEALAEVILEAMWAAADLEAAAPSMGPEVADSGATTLAAAALGKATSAMAASAASTLQAMSTVQPMIGMQGPTAVRTCSR